MNQETVSRARPLLWMALVASLVFGVAEAATPPEEGSAPGLPVPISPSSATDQAASVEVWALHGQVTNVTQWHRRFRSPFSGPNSLQADGRTEETTDVTLYGGVRLWGGTEFWLNPEVDQGFGLDNTVGVAGFPSGEAYKIGANKPYVRLPRVFIRQTIDLGGNRTPLEATANQLARSRAADNLTITIGKFGVTDIFDVNSYAHDPRADLLNWSVIDAGAFDYAADAWGYTYGGAAELTQDSRTFRGGVFQLSKVPNGKITGVDFSQFMLVAELEQRYEWLGETGKVKLLGFLNRGRMANYRDAVEQGAGQGIAPDVVPVRRYSSRPGFSFNVEHAFTSSLGAFVRASANDGEKEAYEFTEINRSLSGGVSLKGTSWGRGDDTLAIAGAVNTLFARRGLISPPAGLGS